MLKINIETIPHDQHRYPTVGDYWDDPYGTLQVRISEMDDPRYEFLVAIHELIEKELCRQRGISEPEITRFDVQFEEEREQGGCTILPRSPETIRARLTTGSTCSRQSWSGCWRARWAWTGMPTRTFSWAFPIREAGPVMDGLFWACIFHLFRLRLGRAFLPVEGSVCCAVPNDFVVPGFVDENWAFEGAFSLYTAPDGFEPSTAAAAVRREGFYVFMAYSGPLAASPSLSRLGDCMNACAVHRHSAASRKASALQSTSQS